MDVRHLLLLPVVLLTTTALPAPAGADVPTCLGLPATIVGTAGPDTVHGTEGDDVIWTGAGFDYVWGNGGNDVICLAEKTDPLEEPVYGDDGDDTNDPNGAELAYGGPGNDRIVGGLVVVAVYGGWGDDEIWAIGDAAAAYDTEGSTFYQGGPGNDVMHGNEGPDTMLGGRGDDVIELGDAAGILEYEGGDDVGRNWATGGPGNDVVTGGSARDFLYGGRGDDRLSGRGADDWLFGDHMHHGTFAGWYGDDVLLGGAGDDRVWGMGGTNSIDAGAGDDECLDPTAAQGAVGCERIAELPEQSLPTS